MRLATGYAALFLLLCSLVSGCRTSPLAFVKRASVIQITPRTAFVDEPVRIVLRHFPANQPITVNASFTDERGVVWESHANFLTDQHGQVDVATQVPLSGTYQRADAAGLFWSMTPMPGSNAPELIPITLKPIHYQFAALLQTQTVAQAMMDRLYLALGVQRISVHENGLRGTLFLPAGGGVHPGIIVLSGSEGGASEARAAFLAAKGYVAFALAYFNYEDLPPYLENIPLEYFQTGIHWLEARPDVRPGGIAVLGGSRGAELALVLGSMFPDIRAVVAIAPSSVVWGGLGTNRVLSPAWTWQGQPIPHMSEGQLTPEQAEKVARLSKTDPFIETPLMEIFLENPAKVESAAIPVEKINGPVLLVSGDEDDLWPSTPMANQIMARLKRAGHPFPDRQLVYAGAGHFIPFPNFPATINSVVHPVTKERLMLGGEPGPTATAAVDSWAQIIGFLNANYSDKATQKP